MYLYNTEIHNPGFLSDRTRVQKKCEINFVIENCNWFYIINRYFFSLITRKKTFYMENIHNVFKQSSEIHFKRYCCISRSRNLIAEKNPKNPLMLTTTYIFLIISVFQHVAHYHIKSIWPCIFIVNLFIYLPMWISFVWNIIEKNKLWTLHTLKRK